MRYCELKQKEVVNVLDGRRLGTTEDLEFDPVTGRICAIVVPGQFSIKNILKSGGGYVIDWERIVKIGDDVVLVELDGKYFHDLAQ